MPSPFRDWPDADLAVLDRLADPYAVQVFLDQTPYSCDPIYRSPRSVLRDGRAHCFDGALFAACALRRQGFPPRIVDLRAHNDDDHVIAVFRIDGCWGAIAKSNTTVLRYREPVYRSIRELAMSYFDLYYNLKGDKALREVSIPVGLARFDRIGWMERDDDLEQIAEHLDRVRHQQLLTPAQVARLSRVDQRLYDAGLMGSDPEGLFVPR